MPPKAAWLELEANPELEFEFFLAAELGMTLGRLRQELSSNQEFVYWQVFYGRKTQSDQLRMAGPGVTIHG